VADLCLPDSKATMHGEITHFKKILRRRVALRLTTAETSAVRAVLRPWTPALPGVPEISAVTA
jgi:hypothetical protein